MKLSVVAPMYNEESSIELFLSATLDILQKHYTDYELILIDDGSSDQTVERCLSFIKSNPHIRLLVFSRNYGHEIASTAGIENATGDYVILMDCDLQHPPELIPQMLQKAQEGYDVVCASRENRITESWWRRVAAVLFYGLSRNMTGLNLRAAHGNYRLMSRRVVDAMKQMKESNRHLVTMFAYIGYKVASIPYCSPPRMRGRSKYSFGKLVHLSLDAIIGFSGRPLRFMSCLSLCMSFVIMIYMGKITKDMTSIHFLISALFVVLFLFLAIISEYISRILIESKNRPLYYLAQEIRQQSFTEERQG